MSEARACIGVDFELALAPRYPADEVELPTRHGVRSVRAPMPLEERLAARAEDLIARIKATRQFLAASRGGVFISNGARIYRDGTHLEYATPEASNPLEAAAHFLAAWRLLYGLLKRGPGRSGERLSLYDINLDYAEPHPASWACHENHLFTGPAGPVRRALTPHLCSRVILSGAGGFDPYRPLAFVLSPRAHTSRPLWFGTRGDDLVFFHGRQEPYASGGIDRLHIVCGESLRSHRGNFLKLGTTALLVWLAQRGHEIDRSFRPMHASKAFQIFSSDPSGRACVACQGGRARSAMEIQWALLGLCERVGRTEGLPDWAGLVLALWRDSLERFESGGQAALRKSFDWAMKWAVFDSYCRERGTPLDELLRWDAVLAKVFQLCRSVRSLVTVSDIACLFVTRHVREKCEQQLGAEGNPFEPDWDDLELVLELRLALRELDWRFSEVGEGIFDRLDAGGWLDHGVPGLTAERIQKAMTDPPQDTRAKVRGHWVSILHGSKKGRGVEVSWDVISDHEGRREMRLPNPCVAEGQWSSTAVEEDPESRELLLAGVECYHTSRFMDASAFLRRAWRKIRWREADVTEVNSCPFRVLRYSAWVSARIGRFEALNYLHQLYGPRFPDAPNSYWLGDHLYCHRFLGLAPDLQMEHLVPAAMRFLQSPPSAEEPNHAHVREHVGAYLLSTGRLEEAMKVVRPCESESAPWRSVRLHCLMSDIARRLGRATYARDLLDAAHALLRDQLMLLAEQILPMRAKLLDDRRERIDTLVQATDILRAGRHPMALGRALLMRVRDCRDGSLARVIRREFGCIRLKTPALRVCPLARKICSNWKQWTMSFEPDERGDAWWGL